METGGRGSTKSPPSSIQAVSHSRWRHIGIHIVSFTGAHAAVFSALVPASHRLYVSLGCATENDDSFGTHTIRRTKATLIYRRTKNLRAVQLLLGHTKLKSILRYLGIEVDDAVEMAEQTQA